jgi:hypothetical protein
MTENNVDNNRISFKIDPDRLKDFSANHLRFSDDILPPFTIESIDPELVQNIDLRIHSALEKWFENGLDPKYIKLNKSAYAAYYLRRVTYGVDVKLPDMVFEDYPIILDLDSDVLIKVIGSASTESLRAEEIKKMTRENVISVLNEKYPWYNWGGSQ